MIRWMFIGFVANADRQEGDRWYFRYHSKEAIRAFGAWMRSYVSYRSYDPTPEMERFGAIDGRLTEIWLDSVESIRESHALQRRYTPSSFKPKVTPPRFITAVTMIPAWPTEDILGKEPMPEDRILRWVYAIRYPDGVSRDVGDKWYLEVHSQEKKQQPGLLRYVSHRTVEQNLYPGPWHRVSELWYEDFDAWRKGNIESPPNYSAPPWSGGTPFADMRSIFVPHKPDVDFLRDHPQIP